ncbi:Conserved oligomeric Golgi complex subunit 2 [Nakaseomyces bracarensis]|uniref:Conserved oligomeric Golgi complex subunit 2 n=1 Tax=Nakaseomyces bracarensis TaxID=273131 RepID=A0ABR4NUH4_9SACH
MVEEIHDEYDLPAVAEVSRDLFSTEADNLKDVKVVHTDDKSELIIPFDVDTFLMNNNFHYVPLDTLTRQLTSLSDEMMLVLLERVGENYDSYLDFCKVFQGGSDNDTAFELQKLVPDLNSFTTSLKNLTEKDMPRTQETVQDTIDYLEKLEEIQDLLGNHLMLSEDIITLKKLSKSLHSLCDTDPLEEELCVELTSRLFNLFTNIQTLLDSLTSIDSPFLHHLRNEFQGTTQEFQISLKLLTDRCLQHTDQYTQLSILLASIYKELKK